MLITKQNRLLPILAAIVVLMLVLVLSKSCNNDRTENIMLDSVPMASAPDADTPADTIKTLTANVAAMTAELQALRQANTSLGSDNKTLLQDRDELEERVATRIDHEFASREKQQGQVDVEALTSLSERVDALSEALAASLSNTGKSDIPV